MPEKVAEISGVQRYLKILPNFNIYSWRNKKNPCLGGHGFLDFNRIKFHPRRKLFAINLLL